jgi:hypothetical protein
MVLSTDPRDQVQRGMGCVFACICIYNLASVFYGRLGQDRGVDGLVQ